MTRTRREQSSEQRADRPLCRDKLRKGLRLKHRYVVWASCPQSRRSFNHARRRQRNHKRNVERRGSSAISRSLFFAFSLPLSTCILSDLSCGVILGGLDSPSVTTFRHFNRFVCFPPPIQYVYTNLLCCTVRCFLYVRQIKGGSPGSHANHPGQFIQTRPPLLSPAPFLSLETLR
ncbi:hypothetical protein P167DRAFT_437296 [Morchella conica CCBAS932]|uniref:Uncharacterized protein n=1 Tax=Morchella conica CCBAS932 TaxID=1392247 RepID=A0A3N4K948_9PEZI|nr:hypothetical protein P167DRAFT_437296 [Morchella conica CCBAS932]